MLASLHPSESLHRPLHHYGHPSVTVTSSNPPPVIESPAGQLTSTSQRFFWGGGCWTIHTESNRVFDSVQQSFISLSTADAGHPPHHSCHRALSTAPLHRNTLMNQKGIFGSVPSYSMSTLQQAAACQGSGKSVIKLFEHNIAMKLATHKINRPECPSDSCPQMEQSK